MNASSLYMPPNACQRIKIKTQINSLTRMFTDHHSADLRWETKWLNTCKISKKKKPQYAQCIVLVPKFRRVPAESTFKLC